MNKSLPSIILQAFFKMEPRYWLHNPMLAIVFIIACLATTLLIAEINFSTGHIALYFQMTFWIWMTLFFSAFADSYAESKIRKKHSHRRHIHSKILVKKLSSISDLEDFVECDRDSIKSGDLILLYSGDIVPFDGIVKRGKCYVNETNITGELDSNLKGAKDDNILTSGTVIEGGDFIVMKVSFASKISFFARVSRLINGINRQSLPSEVALQRIILGLSILFISAIFTIWVIAKYSGFNIPLMYVLDLVVILLPTTISGLQHAVILFGKAKLNEFDIYVQDHVALDNVVDVNVLLIDKTGTVTIGHREMISFLPVNNFQTEESMRYIFLSSISDHTHEGKSIKSYASRFSNLKESDIDNSLYHHIAFSPSRPISGCNYKYMGKDVEIRKGSVSEIAKYLEKSIRSLPKELLDITKDIAKAHGTPILVTLNKDIIGVIHLRDRFRKGIAKQIEKIHKNNIRTILVTGDNELTASYVAQKLGVSDSYSDATPEKKLNLIRRLQRDGYIVAMCGDGANDALALAQADLGLTFEDSEDLQALTIGNVITKTHDLSAILKLKDICKKMTFKRGALTVFSLASDIAKYFVIVPALFITAFPPLSMLNFMQFNSLEGVVLASVMFNALIILLLTPILVNDYNKVQSKYFLWSRILLYGISGIISPFVFIKLLENFIYSIGLL